MSGERRSNRLPSASPLIRTGAVLALFALIAVPWLWYRHVQHQRAVTVRTALAEVVAETAKGIVEAQENRVNEALRHLECVGLVYSADPLTLELRAAKAEAIAERCYPEAIARQASGLIER